VRRILSFKGVLFLKHLLRGVSLGLFDEATAMEKFTKWSGEHEQEFAKRQESHKKARPKGTQPFVKREKKAEQPAAEESGAETATDTAEETKTEE
jgi:small subunit ribosomal protein S16